MTCALYDGTDQLTNCYKRKHVEIAYYDDHKDKEMDYPHTIKYGHRDCTSAVSVF